MSKKLMLISGLVLFVVIAVNAKDEPKERGAGRREKGLAEALELSPEKSAELRENIQKMHQRMRELKEQHDAAQRTLNKLLDADPIDESAVWQAVDKLNQITSEMTKTRVSTRLAVNKNLNSEQKARMKELRKEMTQRHGERTEKSSERFQRERESFRKQPRKGEESSR